MVGRDFKTAAALLLDGVSRWFITSIFGAGEDSRRYRFSQPMLLFLKIRLAPPPARPLDILLLFLFALDTQIATFTCVELCSYETFVYYALVTNMLFLDRPVSAPIKAAAQSLLSIYIHVFFQGL